MNQLEKYMENLKEPALKQVIRFIVDTNDIQKSVSNIGFIKLQIEEFARMYPEFEDDIRGANLTDEDLELLKKIKKKSD